MPQSLSNVILHVVFSTKNRAAFLLDKSLREETQRYLGGVAKKLNCQPLIVGGAEDHVHLMVALSRTITIADCVKEIKRVSSTWLRSEKGNSDFHWQSGYGVFSVSASQVDAVRAYIKNQDKHHQKMTFQDEFRLLLKKHNLQFDEQYVWD